MGEPCPSENTFVFTWAFFRYGNLYVFMKWMYLFGEWTQVLTMSSRPIYNAMMMAELGEGA